MPQRFQIALINLPKSNMEPQNWWVFIDVSPFPGIGYFQIFSGSMRLFFGGVITSLIQSLKFAIDCSKAKIN